ncbi:RNA ligase family protein [Dactylosporangium sp. NPDC051541]|uniref:RNA ligase family protein n=1 Tax=Dactylosporangium sp. NPDC051541 TaxID=3363977 RepID=UPI003799232D
MLRKYPRTPHVQGSRLQPGDHDLAQVPFAELAGRTLVVEEKLDGANAAISFDADGTLRLQSRGHYLSGGPREKQFAPFKAWAAGTRYGLWPVLRDRFIVYGEWLYAKHTVFYDALPHHFCEFDVYDRQSEVFLSTSRRRELLAGLGIASVPVLAEDVFTDLATLTKLAGPSTCRTGGWRDALREAALTGGADPDRVVRETDMSEEMEGLYLKLEDAGTVLGRYKWVRPSFHTAILDSGSHWQDRPIVANRVRS